MEPTNIDSDIPLKLQPIATQEQTTSISGLPIHSNQALNLPTQVGQYQDSVTKNKKLSINTQQQTKEYQSVQKQDGMRRQKIEQRSIQLPHAQVAKTQAKEQQILKNEQCKHFFMSIKSEQSQVALLDQSSDNTPKNNEANRLESDFPNQVQSVRMFNVKNKECHSENHSGKSSSEESQNISHLKEKQGLNQFEKINPIGPQPVTENTNNQVENSIADRDTKSNQLKETIANHNIFTTAKTQQIVLDRRDNQSTIQTQQSPKIINQQPIKQVKLNLVSCSYSLAIDKQTIFYQKEEQKTEELKANTQRKVEPLDIKTLSVLTLSSPEVIKSIRPPSPKISGQRKAKPWQKLKKAKRAQTQAKESNPTSEVAQTQSMISRTISSSIQNSTKVEQTINLSMLNKENENIKSEIVQSKVQVSKPSLQQLKISYPYLSSVIQPTKQNESIPIETRIVNEQQKKLQKQQQKQAKPIQQSKSQLKEETNPIQIKSSDTLVHQQAKNHPLLRHYPIQYKSISKQQALAEPPQTIIKQQNIQSDSKDKQLPIANRQDNQMTELQINQLDQKLSEKKSAGSEIINDSSFENKKSYNVIDVKKRLYQLQMQIEKQKKINQQLQVSSTFQRKLLLSLLTGLTAGSLSFFLRKNKLGSVLLALATGVSTFIIKK